MGRREQRRGRQLVVAGSFADPAAAEEGWVELAAAGIPATVFDEQAPLGGEPRTVLLVARARAADAVEILAAAGRDESPGDADEQASGRSAE